jgi:outer membrane receptor protein involved in Fe transport
MVIGGRYEHTDIAGDYDRNETRFANSYGNLLPSFIINRSFKNLSSLKFTFNQRIRRPGLFFVNPYIQQENPLEQRVGNPDLLPEKTDQLELNYNTFFKGITLNGSVFYRYTSDIIEEFLEITDETISRTSFRNIGQNRSLGVSLYTSLNIKEKLVLRGGGNLSTYDAQGVVNGIALRRTAMQWNANLNATLTLPKGFKFETFGFFNAPRQSLQGSRAAFSQVSFGLVKEFSRKFNLGINLVQPFTRDLRFENELETPVLLQRSFYAVASRSIGVSFSYRFGKLDFRQRGERGERNNDLKQGEENNQ